MKFQTTLPEKDEKIKQMEARLAAMDIEEIESLQQLTTGDW